MRGYRIPDGGERGHNDDADVNRDRRVTSVDALMIMPSEVRSKSFEHSQKIEMVIPMWTVKGLPKNNLLKFVSFAHS